MDTLPHLFLFLFCILCNFVILILLFLVLISLNWRVNKYFCFSSEAWHLWTKPVSGQSIPLEITLRWKKIHWTETTSCLWSCLVAWRNMPLYMEGRTHWRQPQTGAALLFYCVYVKQNRSTFKLYSHTHRNKVKSGLFPHIHFYFFFFFQ